MSIESERWDHITQLRAVNGELERAIDSLELVRQGITRRLVDALDLDSAIALPREKRLRVYCPPPGLVFPIHQRGDLELICPRCGSRDTASPDWSPKVPCSNGCGALMAIDVPRRLAPGSRVQ
jgi:hypothetical protein